MRAVILAAGVGSRLGRRLPKSLTTLPTGRTIMENQVVLLNENGVRDIVAVVGFKKEIIMEEYPQLLFRYNPLYHITNTSKSLMMALESLDADDVVWLNGDVFLDGEALARIVGHPGNVIAVNRAACGEEEVKYKTDSSGKIVEISKKVHQAEGEAVGINKISKKDFPVFLDCLRACQDSDYFEMGIELSINRGVVYRPIDISDCTCVEVDFKKDLDLIQKKFEG